MPKQQIAKKTVNQETGVVEFKFSNDNVLSIDVGTLSPEVTRRLALHGLSQKIGDSYAGAESVEDAYEVASEVAVMLRDGKWTERTAGEPRTSALSEALAKVAGQTIEASKAVVDAMNDEQRKALRNHPQVKVAMAEIRAEKERAKASTSPIESLGALFAPK